VIDVLAALGLRGERIAGLTGVWLDGCKVAAIGVGARRWISQHGLALNVDGDLSGFAQVVPCGIRDRAVGRLVDWLPQLTLATVQPLLLQAFAQRFSLRLRPPSRQETLQGW
jgi:lipoyl(octanoyl) transferase